MYQFSRSIYRELAPLVIEDPGEPTGCASKQEVLDACEATMLRLARDSRYFANPARWLFREVRIHFTLGDQPRVYQVIDCYMQLAVEYLSRLPQDVGPFGERRQCRASTRKGSPCQRDPLPGKDYCPSHKHLEEPLVTAGAQRGPVAAEPVPVGAAS